MSAIEPDHVELSVPEHVLARRVGEETVLLHVGSGSYYSLDAVGTRSWELVCEHGRLEPVHRALVAEYEVGRQRLWRDLRRLVDQLAAAGLLEVRSDGP